MAAAACANQHQPLTSVLKPALTTNQYYINNRISTESWFLASMPIGFFLAQFEAICLTNKIQKVESFKEKRALIHMMRLSFTFWNCHNRGLFDNESCIMHLKFHVVYHFLSLGLKRARMRISVLIQIQLATNRKRALYEVLLKQHKDAGLHCTVSLYLYKHTGKHPTFVFQLQYCKVLWSSGALWKLTIWEFSPNGVKQNCKFSTTNIKTNPPKLEKGAVCRKCQE